MARRLENLAEEFCIGRWNVEVVWTVRGSEVAGYICTQKGLKLLKNLNIIGRVYEA